ncbi:MAG: HlyD family efflux transporter periplasmic adaptor subunit [Pseudomonadales bacterium]
MSESLFRVEVYAGRQDQGLGDAWIGPGSAPLLLSLLLFSTTALALIYLCTATHARSVSAYGFLFAEQATARVRFDAGSGVVVALHVTPGSRVAPGDPLLTVENLVALDGAGRDGASRVRTLTQRLNDGFAARLAHLETQQRGVEDQHVLSRNRLSLELKQLDSELGRLQVARELRSQRLRLAQEKSGSLERLHARRVISDLDWMDHQSLVLGLQEELLALEGQIATVQVQRTSGGLRLAEADALHDEAQSQLAARRAELQLEHDTARVGGQRVLLAPKAGSVEALEAHPGMVVQGGMALLDIVSSATELRARLLVPDRAAGFVEPGQRLHLRFDAFPHQHFGTQPARLVGLNRTVTEAGETIGAYRVEEAVYIGEARLTRQEVASARGSGQLRAGMRFVAELELETRTLMQWLLEPLLDPLLTAERG